MSSPIEQAMRQICEEKGLSFDTVLGAISSALGAAYRKDFGDVNQNIEVNFDPGTGDMEVFDVKTVVEDVDLEELAKKEEERKLRLEEAAKAREEALVRGEDVSTVTFGEEEDEGPKFNPKTDIMISEARVLKFSSKIGDVIRTNLPVPGDFGRMAAMTAKQVVMQKLREAEREIIFSEFKGKEGEILNGTVQRREGRIVLVDLARTTGILKPEDQIESERYAPGDRIKVFVRQVSLGSRGPEILLSRTSEELVKALFLSEIPEISEAALEIKAVAREAGSRSKVAVAAIDPNIDPIGACIGQRGTRIQTIIAALGGEKIDLIEWNENQVAFISHALAPAKVKSVELLEDEHVALVKVDADQLSLAIGRGGQNVRLAARITGWKINVDEVAKVEGEAEEKEEEEAEVTEPVEIIESETMEEKTTEPQKDDVEEVVVESEPVEEVKEAEEE
ncbi:MAG: NusA antitermination factor [Candidatus Uhrbacteria bacterium GW2011_GWE2_45_35]|uniref:Transcription termination/antitermination protein NusA n=2 Tax=Candidatus Uhriibacteriota TaxID=1752732 RepID=A0A0G1JF49_9BACT|nr:MAG: NusA antitermination factor [Candidatus Uhrbacteria bacterium GW2011_GWF2_44_350]KKU07307.1 MAG: NusA antitermination factor [Candidatus Uhrbacteria bacterium GW2011_GWE2_45_35]HBR80809.1 transcription termination/antitermination protein NusA [Candidatus Uhrbacteria bacterium]HCU31380.1 transcription termination/antitermination protein NusA [Candidatus Uhrbacteria bacterium]